MNSSEETQQTCLGSFHEEMEECFEEALEGNLEEIRGKTLGENHGKIFEKNNSTNMNFK